MSNPEKVSYAKTVYGQEEVDAVVKCLRESTQMGTYSRQFEQKIGQLFDKTHCLYVNSGSSALFIGIEALNLPSGSEVITPSLTFSTTVGCLFKNNLIPAFVDVEPLTYCIDHNQIENMINEKTVAILAPNLMGNICNWPAIKNIADNNNLLIIEDSADTLGATIDAQSTGKFTDLSITSFYGSHIINCAGNGGALCVNSEKVMRQAKLLRSWGRSSSLFDENSESIENRFNVKLDGIPYDSKFVFETVGYNLEGSEIGAAFGLVQLEKLKRNIAIRRKNFKKHNIFFKKFSDFFETPQEHKYVNTGWLAYPLLIKPNAGFSRTEFQIYLEKNDIQTRVVFTGNIIRQPMCKGKTIRTSSEGYKNSDSIMERGVLLPLHHGLTENSINRVWTTIEAFIEKSAK